MVERKQHVIPFRNVVCMSSHANYKTITLLGEGIQFKSTKYSKRKTLKILLLLDTCQNSIC